MAKFAVTRTPIAAGDCSGVDLGHSGIGVPELSAAPRVKLVAVQEPLRRMITGDTDKTPENCSPGSGLSRTVYGNRFSYRRPMCSPPAGPTSAPLGGSMIEDRAVVDHSGTARSEDLSDISSKGLLPQLIDVLHALAEGQELLSRRIRDAKVDYARDSVPVVERCPRAESSDVATPHSLVGASPAASIGIRSEAPTDKGDLGPGPPSVNGYADGSSPEPSTGATAATVNLTVPEAAPPSNPPVAIVTPTDLSREAAARTDWLNPALPDDTATEALNRNYNFFDELDARLADLQDPAGRSDDS